MKLTGPIATLSLDGFLLERGDDGAFEVPDDRADELCRSFGLERFEPPARDAPAPRVSDEPAAPARVVEEPVAPARLEEAVEDGTPEAAPAAEAEASGEGDPAPGAPKPPKRTRAAR